jgi:dsDNA-specific endonuclease/ATPase MutS2
LNEEIEDDILARIKDRGKLSKRKNPMLDALENRPRRKERQASEALKTWVKLT